MKNIVRNTILILLTSLPLQGCFVAGAAVGAAGIAAVYDHRKIEQIATDTRIASRIEKKIVADIQLNESSHINVTCFNQIVLLTGEANTAELRNRADQLAHSVPDVIKVYNQINIKGPSSALTRTSDTWITTKIKTEMLATQDLKSGSIKVVTENGCVYLMGIVTRDQADTAADIARQVSGVQKVVKMFQYK